MNTGWRSKPTRIIVSAESVRKLELIVNDKEKNDWRLVSKFKKEDGEVKMTDPTRTGLKYKPRYSGYNRWFCTMEYTRDRVLV